MRIAMIIEESCQKSFQEFLNRFSGMLLQYELLLVVVKGSTVRSLPFDESLEGCSSEYTEQCVTKSVFERGLLHLQERTDVKAVFQIASTEEHLRMPLPLITDLLVDTNSTTRTLQNIIWKSLL